MASIKAFFPYTKQCEFEFEGRGRCKHGTQCWFGHLHSEIGLCTEALGRARGVVMHPQKNAGDGADTQRYAGFANDRGFARDRPRPPAPSDAEKWVRGTQVPGYPAQTPTAAPAAAVMAPVAATAAPAAAVATAPPVAALKAPPVAATVPFVKAAPVTALALPAAVTAPPVAFTAPYVKAPPVAVTVAPAAAATAPPVKAPPVAARAASVAATAPPVAATVAPGVAAKGDEFVGVALECPAAMWDKVVHEKKLRSMPPGLRRRVIGATIIFLYETATSLLLGTFASNGSDADGALRLWPRGLNAAGNEVRDHFCASLDACGAARAKKNVPLARLEVQRLFDVLERRGARYDTSDDNVIERRILSLVLGAPCGYILGSELKHRYHAAYGADELTAYTAGMKLSRFVAELILVENCGPTGYPAVSAHAALQNFAPEPGPGAAAIKPALKKAAAAPAAAPGFAFAVGANALGAILDKRTFAAPLAQLSAMRRIDASTLLFCVDRGSRELLGVFRGNGRAGTDLEPAFGPLRAQIRFTGAAARVTVAGALPAGALSVEETIRCAELLRISGEAL